MRHVITLHTENRWKRVTFFYQLSNYLLTCHIVFRIATRYLNPLLSV